MKPLYFVGSLEACDFVLKTFEDTPQFYNERTDIMQIDENYPYIEAFDSFSEREPFFLSTHLEKIAGNGAYCVELWINDVDYNNYCNEWNGDWFFLLDVTIENYEGWMKDCYSDLYFPMGCELKDFGWINLEQWRKENELLDYFVAPADCTVYIGNQEVDIKKGEMIKDHIFYDTTKEYDIVRYSNGQVSSCLRGREESEALFKIYNDKYCVNFKNEKAYMLIGLEGVIKGLIVYPNHSSEEMYGNEEHV